MWQQWANGIVGLIVIALPFLGLSAETVEYSVITAGAVVAILGFWGAVEHGSMMTHSGSMRHA